MLRFRLRLDHAPVSLYQPSGGIEALHVDPGQIVDVAGQLVTRRSAPKTKDDAAPEPLPADAYTVDVGSGEERAWPMTTWELVDDKAVTPNVIDRKGDNK